MKTNRQQTLIRNTRMSDHSYTRNHSLFKETYLYTASNNKISPLNTIQCQFNPVHILTPSVLTVQLNTNVCLTLNVLTVSHLQIYDTTPSYQNTFKWQGKWCRMVDRRIEALERGFPVDWLTRYCCKFCTLDADLGGGALLSVAMYVYNPVSFLDTNCANF